MGWAIFWAILSPTHLVTLHTTISLISCLHVNFRKRWFSGNGFYWGYVTITSVSSWVRILARDVRCLEFIHCKPVVCNFKTIALATLWKLRKNMYNKIHDIANFESPFIVEKKQSWHLGNSHIERRLYPDWLTRGHFNNINLPPGVKFAPNDELCSLGGMFPLRSPGAGVNTLYRRMEGRTKDFSHRGQSSPLRANLTPGGNFTPGERLNPKGSKGEIKNCSQPGSMADVVFKKWLLFKGKFFAGVRTH
jgi:hypothetical protein